MSVRAPVGDVGKTDYDIVVGRGVCAIKGNEFIYQTLWKMKLDGYWNSLSSGSTFESINSNDVKNSRNSNSNPRKNKPPSVISSANWTKPLPYSRQRSKN